MALSNYSYVIKLNEISSDFIDKAELPYDPTELTPLGIDAAKTFVGQLSPDKKSWVVAEPQRNVHMYVESHHIELYFDADSSIKGRNRRLGSSR